MTDNEAMRTTLVRTRLTLHEVKDEAQAGCYKAEAKNFGHGGLEDLTSRELSRVIGFCRGVSFSQWCGSLATSAGKDRLQGSCADLSCTYTANIPSLHRLRSSVTDSRFVPAVRLSTVGRRAVPVADARI